FFVFWCLLLLAVLRSPLLAVACGRLLGIRLLTERAACGRSIGLLGALRGLAQPGGRRLLHLTALVAHLDVAGVVRRGVLELLLGLRVDETLRLDLGLVGARAAHLHLEVVEVA